MRLTSSGRRSGLLNWHRTEGRGRERIAELARERNEARETVDYRNALVRSLADSLKKITFMARTSGGWKPDAELIAACEQAEQLLSLPGMSKVIDERDALRAEVERAIPAMREYARNNPLHGYAWPIQDPNGVHVWLSRNDRAALAPAEEQKTSPRFDEDGYPLCPVCGRGVRYGVRHSKCGERVMEPAEEPKPRDLDALAIRFLTWKLPDDVCADPCASNPGYPGRSGTNLLNAPQARAMLAYVLDAEEPKT